MTATTHSMSNQVDKNLRPLNIRRDLGVVADLVELCFAESLDADGHRYIQQMRKHANSPYLLSGQGNPPYSISGYVWEEHGRIVGNLNLIPARIQRQRAVLIANVSVHPDYRRRGIARALTEAALGETKRRGINQVWLQARAENSAALHLYQQTGFQERFSRNTWHSVSGTDPGESIMGIRLSPRQSRDWPLQRKWLRRIYPGEVNWHIPFNLNMMSPGLSGAFHRLINERTIKQWSAYNHDNLIGAVAWQSSSLQADWVWLGTSPAHEELAVESLLRHVRRIAPLYRLLAVNYPADTAVDSFRRAGFEIHETLVWMRMLLGKD